MSQDAQDTIEIPEEEVVSLLPQLVRLKEETDWLSGMVDPETAFLYGWDNRNVSLDQGGSATHGYGYAYGLGYSLPGYTACFYINEQQLKDIRARSRAFCTQNPYWKGTQHNIRTHVIGKGMTFVVAPKHKKDKLPEGVQQKIQDYIDETLEENHYREIQCEMLDRQDRDGESFLRFFEDEEAGILRCRFVEPMLIWTPVGKSQKDDVWFGVQFAGDYEDPKGYYIRPTDLLGTDDQRNIARWQEMVPVREIQHRKMNVDRNSPRGVPTTYWTQKRLEQAISTLDSMGTLVEVRSRIGLIRKRVNAILGTVQPLLNKNAAVQVGAPSGQTRRVFQFPKGAVIDTNDQTEYTFPSQNIETDKIVASLQADLRAVSASLGLAEYLVSSDSGNSSYSSATVAEGPVAKTFECRQQDMIDDAKVFIKRVIEFGRRIGRLPENTLELVKIDVQATTLAGRNRIQDTQADQILNTMGAMSIRAIQIKNALDPEEEDAQVAKEREEKMKMDAKAAAMMPQPAPAAGGGTKQPSGRQKVTNRPSEANEPRRQMEEELSESAHDYRSKDKVTQEDLAMASMLITDEWLAKVKAEILALPSSSVPPRDQGVIWEYESGIPGVYLGMVDDQQVWAVDMRAISVKHNAPTLNTAGNSALWPFIPEDKLIVDWSFTSRDRAAEILHEVVEYVLMGKGKWAYARAHRVSAYYDELFLLELRPELKALKGA